MTDNITAETIDVEQPKELAQSVMTNVERVIVGHHDTVEHLVTSLLAQGNVLLEDVPGVGKTMLARSIARSIDGIFKRIQFTPDLLPSDVTGVNVFNQKTREFDFRNGPIFANVVLADEINRAPPKTQSALLEAMEEKQVTVDGKTRRMPDPFTVIATQNSVERNRTYDLPIAEIDRFMKKLHLGYPGEDEESQVLARVVGDHPIDSLTPVAAIEDLRSARQTVSRVRVEDAIREYITNLSRYTREKAQLGVSPRGSITLLRAAQARAVLNQRSYVIPDDIQQEARAVLAHRIRVPPSSHETPEELIETALETVEV
ncbi:AAA family ATPase [Halocatena marina]|uniref:AAA family ATPase n=1 Tax=Halocatena marina TaxID=2934937 RepID=A0ABD5YK25_9EURY|nr:AAA family ATPase [Halocatena marina]